MLRNKKHLFFDLDDTVTLTRTPMEDSIYELYKSLTHDIIVISGATAEQIAHQTKNLPFYKLGQNGNHAISPTGEVFWDEPLTEIQTKIIQDHIERLKSQHELKVNNESDLVEHRGAQISYSLIGHHEEVAKKKLCDPDRSLRLKLLSLEPLDHDEVEVKIGGTTCFDYFPKGRHKGFNVKRLIEHRGWNADECIYFGDALVPGGNDEAVIGVIETFPVLNHLHTYEILQKHAK